MIFKILLEGLVVSIMGALIGIIITYIIIYIVSKGDIKKYKYGRYVVLSLFLAFFFTHIFFEVTGLNKLYCREGNACKDIVRECNKLYYQNLSR